jgi:hypothetical protein
MARRFAICVSPECLVLQKTLTKADLLISCYLALFQRPITPKFVAAGEAEIRIAFMANDGSWSTVGRDALNRAYFPAHQPTMNYGWLTESTSDDEYSRVVLHEFGHALGYIHEHQAARFIRLWNKEAVYRYFSGSPNFWSKEDIDHNVLQKYSPK